VRLGPSLRRGGPQSKAQSAVIFEKFADFADAVNDGKTTPEQDEYGLLDLLIKGLPRRGQYLATSNAWG